jgi:hypothetical protein
MSWDTSRTTATLQIWHRGKLWTDDDFTDYEKALRSALDQAPAAGFYVLLDQSDSTSQRPEIAARRADTLKLMLDRGMRRIVLVVPRMTVGMQSTRIARDAGAPDELFMHCRTRDEALDALRDLDAAG